MSMIWPGCRSRSQLLDGDAVPGDGGAAHVAHLAFIKPSYTCIVERLSHITRSYGRHGGATNPVAWHARSGHG